MPLRSVVGRSIAYKLAADAVGRLASFLVVVMIAHQLGARATGVYALANGLAAYLTVISDLGMHLFVTREIASGARNVERLVGSLFLLKASVNAALGTIVSTTILLFFPWSEESQMVMIIAWATLCYSFIEFFTALLRGYNAIIAESTLVLLFRLTRTAAGITVLWIFRDLRILGAAVAGLSALASVCAAWYVFGRWLRPQFWFSGTEVHGWARQYLPIGIGLVVTLLYWRSDIFLLRVFLTAREVGLYDAAYRLFDAAQLFPAIILTVLYPRFAARGGFRYFWPALRALEILAALFISVTFLYGGFFLRLAYGESFVSATPLLNILFLALPIMFVNALLINYLIATRRQRAYVLAASVAFLFRSGINLWSIPRFGISAAALTAVLTECVILVVLTVLSSYDRSGSPGDCISSRGEHAIPER